MLLRKRERKIRRILIVEDEALVAFDNEHMLADAGYEVIATVDNFPEAERVIGGRALDLVLSDIMLSGEGDGYDVARSARGLGVPVLFVSAHAPVARDSALGCLAKPYSHRTLRGALAAVDDLLQGRKPRRVPRGLELFEIAP